MGQQLMQGFPGQFFASTCQQGQRCIQLISRGVYWVQGSLTHMLGILVGLNSAELPVSPCNLQVSPHSLFRWKAELTLKLRSLTVRIPQNRKWILPVSYGTASLLLDFPAKAFTEPPSLRWREPKTLLSVRGMPNSLGPFLIY